MEQLIDMKATEFEDRRNHEEVDAPRGLERRQFKDSRNEDRYEVAEMAEAIDQYKIRHRRRFITFEELFDVMVDLGYHK
ncbi:hypothetical protein MNBD_PLANCTO02-1163 [hydrothermal vent metagenome]|uniref:Uncharacterized protein n=1 Tax=hydrothermal vent metagenome TaxID=652676 RepID=A0A3B1DZ66_9ZZZZ